MILKRLFLGFKVDAPWFSIMPKGRIVAPESRHLTLAFLGEVDEGGLVKLLEEIPMSSYKVGAMGICKELIYLPPKKPNVAALSFNWLTQSELMLRFQQELVLWLRRFGYLSSDFENVFLPHVTLARRPFNPLEWKEIFYPLPLSTSHLHLYESIGQLRYKPLWSKNVWQPISRIVSPPEDACKVYRLMANTYKDLWIHTWLGLGFVYPQVVSEDFPYVVVGGLKEAEEQLNRILKHLDIESHIILDKLEVLPGGIFSCKMFVYGRLSSRC